MSLVPSDPDPFNQLARLIMEAGGTPMHALPRHRVLGGGTRIRFGIPKRNADAIVALCRRQGWRFTQPSGIQMVVDLPWVPPKKPRPPALGEGDERGLPSGD